MEEKKKIIYAGSVYYIIYEGEKVLHLRSIDDRSLVIHCPTKSKFLREYNDESDRKDVQGNISRTA